MTRTEIEEWANSRRLTIADVPGGDFSRLSLGAKIFTGDFRGANFRDASLSYAKLYDADFRDADFRGADLRGIRTTLTNLHGVKFDFSDLISTVSRRQILDAINGGGELSMYNWHTCETAHCIAGWACFLHPEGRKLEQTLSTDFVGRILLGLLGPGEDSIFYASNDKAMEWLKEGK